MSQAEAYPARFSELDWTHGWFQLNRPNPPHSEQENEHEHEHENENEA